MKNMAVHTNITKQVWGQIDFEVGFELSYKIMISRAIFGPLSITEIEIKEISCEIMNIYMRCDFSKAWQ